MPKKKKKKKYVVAEPRQLRELASPVRMVILDFLGSASAACSIREVASGIGRAADSLYYHFRSLEQSGLILPAGQRMEHGKPVRLYTAAGQSMKIDYERVLPESRELINGIANTALRQTQRDFERATASGAARTETGSRNLYVTRMESRLTRRQLGEINRRINEIVDIMLENTRENRGERCAVTVVLSPLSDENPGD